MVRLRSAYYCNIKICMLYLVVYGHWTELKAAEDAFLEAQYRWIYLLHMPMFAYLSGLFLKGEGDCIRQMRRLFPMYIAAQSAAVLLGGGAVNPWTPWWHLWYLLSVCLWSGLAFVWYGFGKGRGGCFGLGICIVLGVLSGYAPWLNRIMSGSRTVAFLPFFWAGLISDPDREWRRYRPLGGCALLLAATAMALWDKGLPVEFLYYAEPYGNVADGVRRMLCYGVSGMLCFFVLTVMPEERYPFTHLGADTLPVYLVHAPLVGILRMFDMDWRLCALMAAALIYGIDRLFKWNGRLFGVVGREWRETLGRFSGGLRAVRKVGPPLSSGPDPG